MNTAPVTIISSPSFYDAERREIQAAVERELFEALISEVSSRFINLPASRIDGEVSGVLKRVSELLDLDRSTIGQFSMDGRVAESTHYCHRPGIAPPPPSASSPESR